MANAVNVSWLPKYEQRFLRLVAVSTCWSIGLFACASVHMPTL